MFAKDGLETLSKLVVLIFSVLVAGCSHWPTAEHRNVTLSGIADLIPEQQESVNCEFPKLSSDSTWNRHDDNVQSILNVVQQIKSDNDRHHKWARQEARLIRPAASPTVNMSEKVCDLSESYKQKAVVGEREWVYLFPPGLHLQARVDSGATTSSLHAENIERFEKDGRKWVSFDVENEETKELIRIERRIVRNVRIKQATSEGTERRAVVKLDVRLGQSILQEIEFTLTDRSDMDMPILLGRNFLRDLAVVDVSESFIFDKYQPKKASMNL